MDESNSGQWGIVELMGHKVIAGFMEKDEMFGQPLLRVDVPETSVYPAFTQFYGLSAVYCITPTSDEVAKMTAESCKINPVSVYAPDLVPIEKHRQEIQDLREQITRLRSIKSLPPGDDEEEEEWQEGGVPF